MQTNKSNKQLQRNRYTYMLAGWFVGLVTYIEQEQPEQQHHFEHESNCDSMFCVIFMCVWIDIDYIGSDIWWHCKQYARTMNIAIRLFRHWAHGKFQTHHSRSLIPFISSHDRLKNIMANNTIFIQKQYSIHFWQSERVMNWNFLFFSLVALFLRWLLQPHSERRTSLMKIHFHIDRAQYRMFTNEI